VAARCPLVAHHLSNGYPCVSDGSYGVERADASPADWCGLPSHQERMSRQCCDHVGHDNSRADRERAAFDGSARHVAAVLSGNGLLVHACQRRTPEGFNHRE